MVDIFDNQELKNATASEMEQALIAHKEMTEKQATVPPVKEQESLEPQVVEETEKVVEEEKVAEAPQEVVEQPSDADRIKKSYDESVKWNTRLSQDIAEIKRQLAQPKATIPSVAEQPEVSSEQLIEAFEVNPIKTSEAIAARTVKAQTRALEEKLAQQSQIITGILAKTTTDEARSKYEDFKTYENEIREELNKLPQEITTNPYYFNQILDSAYWSVKGRHSKDEVERARTETIKNAQVKKVVKEKAYVEGSGKTAVEQPFDINKASLEEHYNYMKAKGLVPNE